MPVKAVYASGVLAVYIRGQDLDQLLIDGYRWMDLTLNDSVLQKRGVRIGLTSKCAKFLLEVVAIERDTMKEQARLVENTTPGYSNKRIRKGK